MKGKEFDVGSLKCYMFAHLAASALSPLMSAGSVVLSASVVLW